MTVTETISLGAKSAQQYRRATVIFWICLALAVPSIYGTRDPDAWVSHGGGFAAVILPAFAWLLVCENRIRAACKKMQQFSRAGFSDEWRSADSSSLGPLIELVVAGAKQGCSMEIPTRLLISLLESADPADGAVLTQRQWAIMSGIVTRRGLTSLIDPVGKYAGAIFRDTEAELLPVIGRALGAIGTNSSIPALDACAGRTDDADLRHDALISIAQIRDRLKYGQDQMLRAAGKPDPVETLLRSHFGSEAGNSELLRPEPSHTPPWPE